MAFLSDGTPIGSAPVVAGVATLIVSTLPVAAAPHVLQANFSGFGGLDPSSATPIGHTVLQSASSAILGSTAATTVYGQPATLIAEIFAVPPGAGTPTGTVTFTSNLAGTIGTANLDSSGKATLVISTLPVGSHSLIAGYAGDTNFDSSAAGGFGHTVTLASTTTTVVSGTNPSGVGQAVTFTATVTPVAPGGGTPTGSVTFLDGATTLGTVTLSGGVATFSTSALNAGAHTITATYAGSTNHGGSSGNVAQTVGKSSTTISLTSSPNPSAAGAPVALVATVTPPATGSVNFFDGATALGSATLNGSGQATLGGLTSLSIGAHSLTAVYAGDANYSGSTSAGHTHNVAAAATTTTLTSSSNSTNVGEAAVFTATVTSSTPGTPTGTVTFRNGATVLGTGALNGAGQATFTTSSLPSGVQSITAAYGGDANFASSTSAPLSHAVGRTATTTTLVGPASSSASGEGATFTATVTSSNGVPTGFVVFRSGASEVGTAALNSTGVASARLRLGIGVHTVTATYPGAGTFDSSTSAGVRHTVEGIPTRVSTPVLRSGTPAPGQLLTFAATVTSDVRITGGSIIFRDGSRVIGTGGVDAGGTAVVTARLDAGVHLITATYEAYVDWASSTSEPFFLTVENAATVQLVSSLNPSSPAAAVTFTATVSKPQGSTTEPTGTVTFRDGSTTLGTATISGGQAAFTASGLTAGEHMIVAAYSGDSNYPASSSAPLTQRVERVTTTTTLAPGADAAGYFLTATVAGSGTGTQRPSGSVQFEDAATGTALGTATLANGAGMLRLQAPLPVGRSIRAVYAGDTAFAGSSSTAMSFVAAADAFSFRFPSFAANAIVSLFGAGFTETPASAPGTTLPTSLGGVSVNVVDEGGRSYPAGLYFVGPGQMNLVVPAGVPAGPARFVVTTARGTFSVPFLAARAAPSLASANGSGSGLAAAHLLRAHADGSQDAPVAASMTPIQFGAATDSLYVILYGTGFRGAAGPTSCSLNGQSTPAMYTGAHSTYAGLDQINLRAPDSLRGAGRVTVTCTADGQTSNAVEIHVQ